MPEAVAVAKHVERFPEDGVTKALENVVAFDVFDPQMFTLLIEVFSEHGIALNPNAGRPDDTAPVAQARLSRAQFF